jgi:hypothetical protein
MSSILQLFVPKETTFRLLDGYTGEILSEVGDTHPTDLPPGSIFICGLDNVFFSHRQNNCLCRECKPRPLAYDITKG